MVDVDSVGDVDSDAISPQHGARLRQHAAAGRCTTNVRQNLVCNVIFVVVDVVVAAGDDVEATSAKQQAKFIVVLRARFARCQVSAVEWN